MKADIIQMEMFGEQVHEVQQKGVRYILRHNPHRAKEIPITPNSEKHRGEHPIQGAFCVVRKNWLIKQP